VGKALLLVADRLRAEEETASAPSHSQEQGSTSRLGGEQVRLVRAVRDAANRGLTTREIAEKADMHPNNAPRALKGLVERGFVSGPEGTPAVWRYVPE
jgi:DNA-binding MarR family transcriptional regulator